MYKRFLSSIIHSCKAHPVFLICLLFPFLAALISRCCLLDPIKFISVQVLFVYLPGYALQRLTGLSYQNKLVRGIVSYATGYVLSIIAYLALLMMSLQHFSLYVSLFLSLLSVVYLFISKRSNTDGELKENEHKHYTTIYLLSLLLCCFIFQCGNLSPMLREGNVLIDQDILYWMRNSVAATKGYPLPELSVAGLSFYYHYFSSIHMAFLNLNTGIEMFDLSFVYSYLITVFLLVSGLYVICRLLIKNNKYVFVAMAFVLFTTNLDMFTHAFLNYHLFKVSFGFAEGVGIFCITLYYYIRLLRGDNKQWLLLIMAMLMLFTTTGLKGPLAAVLLVGIATGSLIMMFMKGRPVSSVVSGVCLLVSFLVPMLLFVVNMHSQSVGNTAMLTVSATDTMFHSHYFEKMHEFLTGFGVWGPLSYAINFVGYLFFVFLIQLFVFFIVFKNRKPIEEEIIIIVMTFMGTALGMFVSQSGMSQMYFLLIAMVLSFLLSFTWLQDRKIEAKKNNRLKAVFVLGLLLMCMHYVGPAIASERNFVSTISIASNDNQKAETGLTVTKAEMEGLRWGRNNLPNDAILLSNKVFFELGARSFWVSAITERQTFFESYHYSNVGPEKIEFNKSVIEAFYNGDKSAYERLREYGVTHAVVFLGGAPNDYPASCKKIYENSDMVIIEL